MAKMRKRTDASVIDTPDQSAEIPERTAAADDPAAPDHREKVAMRAYELYLARGAADGGDFDDWLAAEREIVNRDPSEEDAGE